MGITLPFFKKMRFLKLKLRKLLWILSYVYVSSRLRLISSTTRLIFIIIILL